MTPYAVGGAFGGAWPRPRRSPARGRARRGRVAGGGDSDQTALLGSMDSRAQRGPKLPTVNSATEPKEPADERTTSHEHNGPGYASPEVARQQPPEKFVYVAALYEGTGIDEPDFIAVVDVDPASSTLRRDRRTAPRCRTSATSCTTSAGTPALRPATPSSSATRMIVPGLALLAGSTSSTSPSRARRGSRT